MTAGEAGRAGGNDRTPRRWPSPIDLALLVASTATAGAMLRHYVGIYGPRDWEGIWRYGTLGMLAAPFLLTTSAALVIARCRRPRPGWREAACRPGTFACLAILAEFAINTASHLALDAMWRHYGQYPTFPAFGLMSLLVSAASNGSAVAVGWATLALAGRWRPEPGWTDRSGRALGVAAIAAELLARFFS